MLRRNKRKVEAIAMTPAEITDLVTTLAREAAITAVTECQPSSLDDVYEMLLIALHRSADEDERALLAAMCDMIREFQSEDAQCDCESCQFAREMQERMDK